MHQQSFRLGCASPSRGSRTQWTLVADFKSSEYYCHRIQFRHCSFQSEQAGCFFSTRISLLANSPSIFLSYRTTPVHFSTLCSTIPLHSRTLFQSSGSIPETDYRSISVMNRYLFWTGSLLLWILVPFSFFIGLDLLGWDWDVRVQRPPDATVECFLRHAVFGRSC
jgi:hypothetical protein